MTHNQLQQLVIMMVERFAIESIFSTPMPQIYMHSPYDIFDWLIAEKLITAIELDQLLIAAQTVPTDKRGNV